MKTEEIELTPKEKAKELLEKYDFINGYDGMGIGDDEITLDNRKQCCLVLVDNFLQSMSRHFGFIGFTTFTYWNEVKEEIKQIQTLDT
jgi:hypothetical protein